MAALEALALALPTTLGGVLVVFAQIGNAHLGSGILAAILGLVVLHLAIGAVAAGVSAAGTPLVMDWNISLAPWLAVLLLFVLARVFQQGAGMREDLAGTV